VSGELQRRSDYIARSATWQRTNLLHKVWNEKRIGEVASLELGMSHKGANVNTSYQVST
jgi:hypothetical protein